MENISKPMADDVNADRGAVSDAVAEPWQLRFYLLLGLLTLLRLFMSVYLDLTPDESYYWELSRQLDWSYFDHPPMVAWLIALFGLLPGEHHLYIRLVSVLASAGVAWCLFVIGRDYLNSARVGFIAAFMLGFTPAGMALGFVTTPDSPLAFAWAACALAFLHALHDTRARWWVITGLLLGFGALSKYNMIMFVPGVALVILGFKRNRHLVFTRRYWLMVGLAALGTLPIIYWNVNHDWISFRFQFNHGLAANTRSLLHNVGEYLGGQLGTVGLTLFPAIWFVVLRVACLAWRRADAVRFFLAWLALPSMLFFTRTGLQAKVEANWPQVAYLTAFLLVAEWIVAAPNPRRRFAWVAAPSVFVAMLAVLQCLTLLLPLPPRADVSVRMHGWRQMGSALKKIDAETGHQALFVVQGTTLTTLTGYYGGIESDRLVELYVNGNFRIWWQGRVIAPGRDVVFVDENRFPETERLAAKFAGIASEAIDIVSCGKTIRRINLTRMSGLREPLEFKPNKVF